MQMFGHLVKSTCLTNREFQNMVKVNTERYHHCDKDEGRAVNSDSENMSSNENHIPVLPQYVEESKSDNENQER